VSRFDKSRATYIFALAISFFIFELFLFAKSFNADYNLYLRYLSRMQNSDPFWTSFWFSSELVGEVGLALRFFGSCFFLAFTYLLLKRRELVLSYLKRAVLLEGAYYLFNLPFILSLYLRPGTSLVNIEAGLSYTLQILFVTPAFFMLYSKLRKPALDKAEVSKWGAIAVIGFTFGLWIKHLLLNIYALPINLQSPVLTAGFLNSTFTIAVAGFILFFAFVPLIRKRQGTFSFKAVGTAFVLIGAYFTIYLIVSLFNQNYLNFLLLTELWAIAFVIPGIGLLIKSDS
jgi:hypothetical protein